MSDLAGKVVVITGGNSGIGKETAVELARMGARVVIAARNPTRAAAAVKEIKERTGAGDRVETMPLDLASFASVRAFAGAFTDAHDRLDVLVNNAGTGQIRDTLTLELEAWRDLLDTHLTGAFLMSQAAARVMIPARRGVILNIGSVFSVRGMPRRAAYCTAKHGIVGLTQALACEWAPHGLRVVALGPGYINTAREMPIDFSGEVVERRTPQGRWGTPEEMAEVAAFLCSPRASFVNGSLTMADGGWVAYGGW